jgi:hypothetical protein
MNIARNTEGGGKYQSNTKQNKIKINDNTWPIQGDMILHKVKYEDDKIHESSRVWGLRYQICGMRLQGYEDFEKPYQRWERLQSRRCGVNWVVIFEGEVQGIYT